MDEIRFDDLTRALGAGATRRAGLKAALGGLLGLAALAPGGQGAARKKKKRTLCPTVCPSGSACIDGACACTRPLCGGICCASDRTTCENGRCVYTGLRDCGGVKIVDGADLSFCNLRGRDIANRTLKNANFEGADLSDARFTGQFQPWGCSFRGAKLVGADLKECDLKPGTTFAAADLRNVSVVGAHVDGVDFTGANLGGASLLATRFARSAFARAEVGGAALYGSTFAECDFTGATLTDCAFGKLDATANAFTDCAMDGMTFRPKAGYINRYGLAFSRVSMRGAALWTGQVDINTISWLSVDMTGATGDLPGPRRFGRWCWNVLSDGTQSSQSWGGAVCPCAAGPNACWPTA